MKNLLFVLVLVFFIGCSTKQTFISLKEYVPSQSIKSDKKAITIASVNDMRTNKDVIATITSASGEISEYVVLNNDVATYFKNALLNELNSRGVSSSGENAVVANINITELKANISGYASDNTKASIKVTLNASRGSETITKNFADNQTKFELIRTGGAFSSILKTMIDDMVKRVADGLISL
ncbi:YajG family lipoprotein [Campylobacter sp. 9BO]|uniref:YajG family lipoprotein n=1 Tax=Campylobacter sp. 9BO TaxID=3424759 RepID=UPI003D346764